jgi:predicted small metal-binding protein
MATKVKVISCHDHDPNCHFTVADVDEEELILAAQGHAKRKHGMDVTAEQIRPMIQEKECSCS